MNMRPLSLAALSLGLLLPLGASAAPASRAKNVQSSKRSQSAKKKGSQLDRKIQSGIAGVRVGFNFPTLSYGEFKKGSFPIDTAYGYTPPNDTSTQLGFDAGLSYDIGFGQMIGFRGVASIALKGANFEGITLEKDGRKQEVDAYMNLWHVQITPMLTVRFGEMLGRAGRNVSPFVQIGPFFSLLVMADGKYDGLSFGETESGGGKDKSRDHFRSFDAGISFGAGTFIALGSFGVLSVDLRYDVGIMNIADIDYWRKEHDFRKQEINTRQFQLALGYHF